jgi:hypothetical protein
MLANRKTRRFHRCRLRFLTDQRRRTGRRQPVTAWGLAAR